MRRSSDPLVARDPEQDLDGSCGGRGGGGRRDQFGRGKGAHEREEHLRSGLIFVDKNRVDKDCESVIYSTICNSICVGGVQNNVGEAVDQ